MKVVTAITQYIAYRQAMGELCQSNGRILKSFGRTMGLQKSLTNVRSSQVLRFLNGTGPITSNWHAKCQALRGFYLYAISRGYTSSSPLPTAIPKRPPPFVPYIYARWELRALLHACLTYQKNRSRIEPAMMRTLLLLLYGAGLRVREAIRLTLADVDLDGNCLTIRQTKFRKTRLVPIGPQLAGELKRYAARRRRDGLPQHPGAAFFISRDARPLIQSTVENVFQRIRKQANIRRTDGARYQPRLHDLRHAFAVHRLIAWYQQGADVQQWLPVLSTYLGHTYLAATSVYLTMTPALLGQANRRFQHFAFPENSHD
jgi:site-specific recombinase XerD